MPGKKSEFTKLKKLLLATRHGEFNCLADLNALLSSGAQTAYTATDRIDRTELIRIYSVRKKNEEDGRAQGRALVDGFDSTLTALERSDEAQLVVHGVDYPAWSFTVFTDPRVSKVFGVLRSKTGS